LIVEPYEGHFVEALQRKLFAHSLEGASLNSS